MAVDNQFKETVDALFKGMNGVVSSVPADSSAAFWWKKDWHRICKYGLEYAKAAVGSICRIRG